MVVRAESLRLFRLALLKGDWHHYREAVPKGERREIMIARLKGEVVYVLSE